MAGKIWVALAVLICAAPASADNPRKVAIGPGSSKGALLFKAPQAPVHHMLLFTRADGSSDREYWVGIEPWLAKKGDRYVVETLPAGQYQLEAIYQQGKWVGCLDIATLNVLIEPGKISYVGTLDTLPTLASIQRNATANKQLRAHYGEWHFYRSGIAPPRVIDRDEAGLAQADWFVRSQMPGSAAGASLAAIQWRPYRRFEPSGRANRCDYKG